MDPPADDALRLVLEAEPALHELPPDGRSLGPLRVAEPVNPGNFTGDLTPLRVTHEIEIPHGDLVAVVDFFATRAVTDGFDAPQIACTDLPNEVRHADIIARTVRDRYPVGLHVSIRSQPSTAMIASVTVYDAERQSDNPFGPDPRPCSDSAS